MEKTTKKRLEEFDLSLCIQLLCVFVMLPINVLIWRQSRDSGVSGLVSSSSLRFQSIHYCCTDLTTEWFCLYKYP